MNTTIVSSEPFSLAPVRRLTFALCLVAIALTVPGVAFARVVAARIDVEPGGGSVDAKPAARIAAATPGAGIVTRGGNRGDWDVGVSATPANPHGVPVRQTEAVIMANVNEALPPDRRGGVEVAGKLTAGQGNSMNGGMWIVGYTADGDGAEANVDSSLAVFPFEQGWIGGHIAADGTRFLASGNLPSGSSITRLNGGVRAGELVLRLPGIDAIDDGMLFTVAAGNGDDVTAVGPLPDGSGWHIRVADEGDNYRIERTTPSSFVYVPYSAAGLIGGWVGEDGRVLQAAGSFGVRHAGKGRYEIMVPGATGDSGILIAAICKLNDEGVEDNALAWTYDPRALDGKGAFVVETYDQPSYALQDCKFTFAYIAYDNRLTPGPDPANPPPDADRFVPAGTWAESVVAGLAAQRQVETESSPRFRPWFSRVVKAGDAPVTARVYVAGLKRLWLIADPVDGNAHDRAAWGDPHVALKDGRVIYLAEHDPLFAAVGAGNFERGSVRIGERTFARGLRAHAYSLLCYELPDDAVLFESQVGIEAGAGAEAEVAFRVLDETGRRPFWDCVVMASLRRAFPRECEQFRRDVGVLRPPVDESALRTALAAACDKRKAALAILGDTTATTATSAHDALLEALQRYERCCHLEASLGGVTAQVWRDCPLLAAILDYPDLSDSRLAGRVATAASGGTGATAGAAWSARLDACRLRFGKLLQAALAPRSAGASAPALDADALRAVARDYGAIAEWADRATGWPTFRGDNQRSGVSREQLELPLVPLWTRRPRQPPAPAWPPPAVQNPAVGQLLSPALTYDRAFHPVVLDGKLYYGSSSEDAVFCVDADTGKERWRFATEGPVRLAPALAYGKVYAGCDDGFLYCINGADGALVWRHAAGDEDRRLVGNGRVISQWPVRCGVCVTDGTVYFAAGLFPLQGVYLCAVDAMTGQRVWRESLSVSPQGFMLASPARLFVPTGRTPLQIFDRATGKALRSLGRSDSWGSNLPGGSCALVVNDTVATGPGEGGSIHIFNAESAEQLVKMPGRALLVDGLTAYTLDAGELAALDRSRYLTGRGAQRLWRTACSNAFTMVKSGDRLFVGGPGWVDVVNAENGARETRLTLGAARVEGLAVNRGRLYVSTGDGGIHCFASRGADAAAATPTVDTLSAADPSERVVPVAAAVLTRVRAALAAGAVRRGFGLVVGDASGETAAALAEASELYVVALAGDATAAAAIRGRLGEAGLDATRVSVHVARGEGLPYRPYMANLILVESETLTPELAGELMRVLRPEGGCLFARGTAAAFVPSAGTAALPPEVAARAGYAVGFRRGPLPGAGAWTHAYADGGNTACSGDVMGWGAFDVLWFGLPGPRNMFERHIKAAPPLYADGRVYITGNDYLAAGDAYNGAVLWERSLKDSGRVGILKDCGNMVADDGRLYVAAAGECVALDGASGQILTRFKAADYVPVKADWGYVDVVGGLLLGSGTKPGAELQPNNKEDYNTVWYNNRPVVCSDWLFAAVSETRQRAWLYTPPAGVIVDATITRLGGQLAFVESANPATRAVADGKLTHDALTKDGPLLVSLDAQTGRELWRRKIDLSGFQHAIYMSGTDGMFALTVTRHEVIEGRKLIQYETIGIDAATGDEAWRHSDTPTRAHILDGGHGEQTQHPAIVDGKVYGPGYVRTLRYGTAPPVWKWEKSPQCATLSTSARCAFSRQGGNPTIADFTTGKQQPLTRVTRPGCWINTLPVGRIVVIPEASSGCTCGYSIQSSLALVPRAAE